MADITADIVICGAGIAGISTAYHLAVKHDLTNILIIDREPPLAVTSDKSFEGYRNWWPGPGNAMVALTNRSIDILEAFHRQHPDLLPMDRGGYVFVSADPTREAEIITAARESCELGAGELRIHNGRSTDPSYIPTTDHGLWDAPDGADVILDRQLIQTHFPYLSAEACILLHTRRCGWFAARQFGMMMLEKGRALGIRLLQGEVTGIEMQAGAVAGVRVNAQGKSDVVATTCFVNAAGPGFKQVGQLSNLDLPVQADLHMKVSIADHKQVVPRTMPFTIWYDPIYLAWSAEERSFLAEDETLRWLLDEQPPIVVGRPDGGAGSHIFIMQWDYRLQPGEPIFPLPQDPQFPEYVLRGICHMLPGMKIYLDNMPKPYVDGGYYVRTIENRPLIGPIKDENGIYIIGALSGSGMQLAPAAGELLANQIAGAALPAYAPAFLLERFDDPNYQKLLNQWGLTGNL